MSSTLLQVISHNGGIKCIKHWLNYKLFQRTASGSGTVWAASIIVARGCESSARGAFGDSRATSRAAAQATIAETTHEHVRVKIRLGSRSWSTRCRYGRHVEFAGCSLQRCKIFFLAILIDNHVIINVIIAFTSQ